VPFRRRASAANKAEDGLAKARDSNDFALVKFYEKELAFQLSSHILHTIYWTSISGKGGEPGSGANKAGESVKVAGTKRTEVRR
jgi:Fe-Mn family superoxide dismutase